MSHRLKYGLRWFAVLPGAILAAVLANFPLHWILYSSLSSWIEPYPELPERLLSPLVVAGTLVWAGSRIAPSHNRATAIVLFGLWMFLIGGIFFLTIKGVSLIGDQMYFQGGGVYPLMSAAGAFVGLLVALKQSPSSDDNALN